MQVKASTRVLMIVIAALSLSVMFGCAGSELAPKDPYMFWYYPKELPEADRAVAAARQAGKDKECPSEFNAAEDLMNKAYEVYAACHTEEAIAMAKEATAKANALCPLKPRAEMKAEEPVVVLVSEPKAEEKIVVLASEPKAEEKVIVLALEDIHFDFDKSTLTKEAQVILKRNIRILKENPKAKVRIAGYTSASGTEEYNQKLSERRAKAVEEYLIKEGVVAPDMLTTIGYGKTRPAMHEAAPKSIYSKAAKANMRVLFEIVVK